MKSSPLGGFLIIQFALLLTLTLHGQEPVYSGPQVGENLLPFSVRVVLGPESGQNQDFVTQAGKGPIVLVFLHEVNRQSISLTRLLTTYTKSRAQDGLVTGVILLDDDATAAENQLNRIRHALTVDVPTGVSLDGREGPGSYGLNRKVTLTVLIGKEGKVTGNFALVQPSLQADLPKIFESVVAVVGGQAPKLEDFPEMQAGNSGKRGAAEAPNLRPLLAPVIRRDATPEDVDKAAQAVEERAAQDREVRREVGRIATTIINAGKLEDYGTKTAQEYLKKWARDFGPDSEGKVESKRNRPVDKDPSR